MCLRGCTKADFWILVNKLAKMQRNICIDDGDDYEDTFIKVSKL